MGHKLLRPIEFDERVALALEKEISRALKEVLYYPLVKTMHGSSDRLINSMDDLASAIRSGRLSFYRGKFSGKLSAGISRDLKRLGATWSKTTKSFNIGFDLLPVRLRDMIRLSEVRLEKALQKINTKLSFDIPKQVIDNLKIEKLIDRSIFTVTDKIDAQLDAITVQQKITAGDLEKITLEYSENMELYIQTWTQKEIIKLRSKINKRVMAGGRFEGVIADIQKSYGVSRSKAKFLARQETKLLTSKLKEIRYTKAGVYEYEWRNVFASPAHPVRPVHKLLNKTVQRWDSPPITDEKGSRNHPGEDFGCRCTAWPIVRF